MKGTLLCGFRIKQLKSEDNAPLQTTLQFQLIRAMLFCMPDDDPHEIAQPLKADNAKNIAYVWHFISKSYCYCVEVMIFYNLFCVKKALK